MGQSVPTSPHLTAREFTVHDPATGNVITNCPDLTVSEAELAIDAANKALHSFRRTTGRSRANLLRAWHDQVIRNAQDIATLITLENGKALIDAHSEVAYAASCIEWFAEEATRIYGSIIPASVPGKRIYASRQPDGVCALITPWNFPAAMVTRKIAPALAAGCTVVLNTIYDD
ncbi:Aldehyde/histidinol dehydrogenase [Fusarium sp. MPI-SDFR-AT-0072]|nr:Aldehyde/histidinol dehydrogenase [Fusarium sp. MPI-SDFR-AT-0072]KAI7761721.1 hypothetical protein LZL87_013871 [Fusarium oxysporum]